MLTIGQQYNFFSYIFRSLRSHSKEYNQAERLLEDFKRTHSDATLIVCLREDQLNLFISQENYVGAMHVLEEILDSLDGVMKIDITREHKILQFLYGSVYEYCLMMNNNYDEALFFNDKNLALIKEIEGYERSNEYRGWRVRRCYILDKLHQYDAMYKHVQFLLNDYYNKNNNIFLASRDFNSNIATDSPWWSLLSIENALLRCLYIKGNFQEAKKYVLNVRSLFSTVTGRLESSKWRDEEYERFVSVSMWTPSDTTLAKQVYDYTLAYKSAVLTSWTSLQKLILESDNNEVKEKLTEFNLLREQIQVSKERGDETSVMEEKIRTLP